MTIDPEEWIHVYYWSAFKGIMIASFVSRVKFPDMTCEELSDDCKDFNLNYEAEAKATKAILHSLSDITQMEKLKNNIVIFLDAKSVLQALLLVTASTSAFSGSHRDQTLQTHFTPTQNNLKTHTIEHNTELQ